MDMRVSDVCKTMHGSLTVGQGVAGSNPVIPTKQHGAAFESPCFLYVVNVQESATDPLLGFGSSLIRRPQSDGQETAHARVCVSVAAR